MDFFKELQRRNVVRMAIGYIVSSWLLAQVADLVLENIGSPDWVMQTFMLLLALGFPVVVFFSWAYEVTPDGIKRESEVDRSQSIAPLTGRKLDRAIIFVLLVALAFLAYDRFVLDPKRDAALIETIKQSEGGEATMSRAQDPEQDQDGPPMLAVLPFTSSSLGGESDFFATGVHDDLLTQLAQLQSIRVISRTSVMEYRDKERNVREIGKALGADAILEGGVQSAGDQIRINAQLIDARTDEHLWAQTYDRELTPAKIFEVQTEIARAITTAMQATLTSREVSLLTAMPTENMAAYRAYHRAMEIRDFPGVFDSEGFRQALEEAVELDPSFTQAWAELVGILSLENFAERKPELLRQAEYALEQIRLIAPRSVDYLVAQAFYTYYILRNYDQAYQLIQEAHLGRPNDARILELKSWIQRRMGNIEGRIESIRQARELDPRNPQWSRLITRALVLTHQYDDAEVEIQDSDFDDYSMSYWNTVLQFRKHQDFSEWAEAVELATEAFSSDADPYNLWEAYIASKDFEAARDMLNEMAEQWMVGTPVNGRLPNELRTQIVTYWVSHSNDALAEQVSEARTILEEGFETGGVSSAARVILDMALVTAVEGNVAETERLIRSWERRAADDLAEAYHYRHEACRILGIVGSTARAVECIRKGLEQPSLVMPFMEPILPYYDSMRTEPAFVELRADLDQ